MTLATKIDHPFGEDYAKSVEALFSTQGSWVESLRETSRSIFESQGLPGRKVESWKYTSLTELAKTNYIPAAVADDVDVITIPVTIPQIPGALRLVFVNGAYRADLSDDLGKV